MRFSVLAISLSYRAEGSTMFSGKSGSNESLLSGTLSGMKTVTKWFSGGPSPCEPWMPDCPEDMVLDFVGYESGNPEDLTEIMIPKHTQHKEEWGKCIEINLLPTVNAYPSEETIRNLTIIAKRNEDFRRIEEIKASYDQHRNRTRYYTELIEYWGPDESHKGRLGTRNAPKRHDSVFLAPNAPKQFDSVFQDGTLLLEQERIMCALGLLRKPFEPLDTMDGQCQGLDGEFKGSELGGPNADLINCLGRISHELDDVDRKLFRDAHQCQKDTGRDKGELADGSKIPDVIFNNYERLTIVWTTRMVPWYLYSQGSGAFGFLLLKDLGLPPDVTLKGLSILRDNFTRISRYPKQRHYEYVSWLAHYIEKVLGRHFSIINRIFGDPNLLTLVRASALEQFLLRPITDITGDNEGFPQSVKDPVWDFFFQYGRPAVFAWMVAAIEHADNCLTIYESKKSEFHQAGKDVEDEEWVEQIVRTEYPEDATHVHTYDVGLRNEYGVLDHVAKYFISKPVRAFFGPNGVAVALERAKKLLTTPLERKLSKIESNPPKKKSVLFRKSAESLAADQETTTHDTVPRSVTFSQLVEMMDELVDSAMELKSGPLRPQIAKLAREGIAIGDNVNEDLERAQLEGIENQKAFFETTGWESFPTMRWNLSMFVPATQPAFILQSGICEKITKEVGMEPSMHALSLAKEAFKRPVIHDVIPGGDGTVASLVSLIRSLNPYQIEVDGVVRNIKPRTYDEMLSQLMEEKHKCRDKSLFQFTPQSDLHGCRRVLRTFPMWSPHVLLYYCLMENQTKLNAILSGHLWSLVRIAEAMEKLGISRQDKRAETCTEILSVYAVVFVNDPDAIMNGEPVKWCMSLQELDNGALSKEDTLLAISLLANRFTGLNKFGPRYSKLYERTLMSYWVHAMKVHVSGIGQLIEQYGPKVDIDFDSYADAMLGLGYGQINSVELWTYILANGQYGIASVMLAGLNKRLLTMAGRSTEAADLLSEAKKWIGLNCLDCDWANMASLKQITNMVNVLVNSAMKNNIPQLKN